MGNVDIKNKPSKLAYLIQMIKPVWKYDKAYIVIRVVWDCIKSPLISVLYILMVQTVVNQMTYGENWTTVLITLLIFSLIGFLQNVLGNALWKFYLTPHETKIRAKIQTDIYNTLKRTDYQYFDTPEFFDTYTVTYSAYANKSFEVVGNVSNFLGDISSIGALFSMIITTNYVILVLTVVSSVLQAVIARKNNKLNIEREDKTANLERKTKYYSDTAISAVTDVKCTSIGDLLMTKYNNGIGQLLIVRRSLDKKEFQLDLADDSIASAVTFGIRGTTCLFIFAGSVGVGSFVSMISAADQLAYKVRCITKYFDRFNKAVLDGERIQKFLGIPSKIEHSALPSNEIEEGPFSLQLKNISFSYKNSRFSLKKININIKSGMKVAIVGENGGGKTTLVKLLLRLYDPTEGEILINGKPLTTYNPEIVRHEMGVAFQDVPVYSLTLKENLSAYNTVSDEKCQDICEKMPLLTKMLEKNSATFDSELTRKFDKEGIMPSGGERQVISISRVLSKEFKMLIFDEPVAALDPMSAEIMSNVILDRTNPVTTLFISHRLSSVVDADYIYVFNNGQIEEEGTHNILMEKKGFYYNMFLSQAKKYRDGLDTE